MFPNLRAEMARKNVTVDMLASKLKRTKGTVSQKLNGKSPINLDEAEAIRDYLEPAMTIDELFARG